MTNTCYILTNADKIRTIEMESSTKIFKFSIYIKWKPKKCEVCKDQYKFNKVELL